MHGSIAAVLAIAGLAARAAMAYGPLDCGDLPPCGCEPVVICDPCAVTPEPTPPKAPDQLPAPPAASQAEPTGEGDEPAPATPNEFPSPPNVNTPAVEPPPSSVTPAEEAPADRPATDQPATPESPPADDASRYSTPPTEEPTTPPTDPYEGLFPPDAAEAESETPAAETPSTESPATEGAPAAEEPRTPEYDELFPPSSATRVLSAPGGWTSDAPRLWKDADGRVLAIGRITGVTAQQLVLARDDGAEQAFPYAALSNADLQYLREQVSARRAELTSPADRDRLLAGQQ
jgi:hypothetical protein